MLLLAALLGSGCAAVTLDTVRADVAAGRGHLITTVPFIPQDAYQCGPAALAMVLRYWGAAADAEEIGRALYLPSAQGVLNLELEFEARGSGLGADTSALRSVISRYVRRTSTFDTVRYRAGRAASSWPAPPPRGSWRFGNFATTV